MRAGAVGSLVAVALAAATACGGSGADKAGGGKAGDTLVLTLATRDADEWEALFAREVARLSGGTMRIEIHGDQHLGEADYERSIVEDVRAGRFDLGNTGARVWDTVGATSFQAMLAPFLVQSEEHELRVLEGPIGQRMLAGLERAGIVGVAVASGAIRRPLGLTRSLLRPEDFHAARIGIRPGGVAETTFEALGASVHAYPPGDLSGLDGAELDPWVVDSWGIDRTVPTLTANVALWPLPSTIFADRDSFEALTRSQRGVLRRAGRAVLRPDYEQFQRDQNASLEALCARGGLQFAHASPDDLAALRSAVQPVYDMLERDPLTRELMGAIEEMRRHVPREAPLSCAGGDAADPGTDTSLLEDRWRSKPTAADLRVVGDSPVEARAGQGTWTVVFDDGRLSARQHETGIEYGGSYVVRGDVLSATFDQCPTPECGVILEMRWSVYRDRLTLSAIPGRPFSSIGVAAPWERIR
jgi:TRAP-type C4-dicarboxylate transport system substrate-binding protein